MADNRAFSGRKVFFLNPGASFEADVIDTLRVMEYDAYAIYDLRTAKNIASVHPEGIWFVVMDDSLTVTGWHNFAASLEAGDLLIPPIDVGIIMRDMGAETEKKFLSGLKCNAGVYKASSSAGELLRDIAAALDKLGAIGLRKNIRADCMDDKSAEIYWMKGGKMFKFKMIDVSTAAIATMFPSTLQNEVFVNQIISQAYLTMGKKQVSLPLRVATIKSAGDRLLVIFMYGIDVQPEAISQVRSYISTLLKQRLESEIEKMPKDKVNYNNL